MPKTLRLLVAAAACAVTTLLAGAQILPFTLEEMVQATDNAVYGEITKSRVFRVDHPVDGPELFFTTITIEGRSLVDGRDTTVDVTFHGGFVNEKEGVHNSEAPKADDVKVGNRIVAFYKWTENMGGDVAANALFAAHGGLFRTLDGPNGAIVQGRGESYAIERNTALSSLDESITRIARNR
ncbi:MAG: hypothetical protein WD226_02760 [Planctomycetota bacterium]